MKSKFKRLISGFLILAELVLMSPLTFAPSQSFAQSPPVPTTGHNYVADSGGSGVTDTWVGIRGTRTTKFKLSVSDSTKITEPSINAHVFFYSSISYPNPAGKKFYLGIRSDSMEIAGVYYLDEAAKKYYRLDPMGNISGHGRIYDMGLPEYDSEYGWDDYFDSIGRTTKIFNMTPSTIAATHNIPVSQMQISVTYDETTGNYKRLKGNDLTLAQNKLPPSSPCYLFYKPPGAPIYLLNPIEKTNIGDAGKLQFPNIGDFRAGSYKSICQFHIKVPNDTSAQAVFDWDHAMYEWGWWQNLPRWADMVINTLGLDAVENIVYGEDTSKTTSYKLENYWGKSEATVASNAVTSLGLANIAMIHQDSLDSTFTAAGYSNGQTECDQIAGPGYIANMIAQAFCGLLLNFKQWADTFYCWSLSLFESSVGVTNGGNNATGIEKDNICSGKIDTSAGVNALNGASNQ